MKIFDITYNGRLYSQFTVQDAKNAGVPENVIDSALFEHDKKSKLAVINTQAEKELKRFTETYPPGEISTFDKQETEARAYLLDNTAPTPLLDALATNRGIDKAELVSRVIVKADVFSAASGAIIGKRQKLEDALNALDEDTHTIADIEAITW